MVNTTEAAGPGSGKVRVAWVDALRGIAALAVVVQHSGERLWPAFGRATKDSFDLGRFGVMVFFLVSGYVIPASLERASAGRFWANRGFRLFPLYWASLVAVLVLSVPFPESLTAAYRADLALNTIVNTTMLEGFVGVPYAIGLYYTLTIELAFYALATGLLVVGALRHPVRVAWGALGTVVVAAVVAPLLLDRRAPLATMFALASMFVASAVAAHDAGRVRARSVRNLVAGAGAIGLAGGIVRYVHGPLLDDPGELRLVSAMLPWAAAYGLFFTARARRGRFAVRALVGIGVVSYSLYLGHPVVLTLTSRWSNEAAAFVVVLVGSLALAVVGYRLVERPGIAVGRRVLARPAKPAAGDAVGSPSVPR